MTTAAGLWAAAAVGLSVGIGLYEAAVIGGAVIFIVLSLIHSWDNKMRQNSKMIEIYVELTRAINLGDFLRRIREMALEVESIQNEKESADEDGKRSYIIMLRSRRKRNHEILFQNIRDIEGVDYVEGL